MIFLLFYTLKIHVYNYRYVLTIHQRSLLLQLVFDKEETQNCTKSTMNKQLFDWVNYNFIMAECLLYLNESFTMSLLYLNECLLAVNKSFTI